MGIIEFMKKVRDQDPCAEIFQKESAEVQPGLFRMLRSQFRNYSMIKLDTGIDEQNADSLFATLDKLKRGFIEINEFRDLVEDKKETSSKDASKRKRDIDLGETAEKIRLQLAGKVSKAFDELSRAGNKQGKINMVKFR